MNVQEALQKRRSVRKFTDMPVSEADVALLLHAAMSGPSACNRCPWEFYVISNEGVLSALRKASRYTNIPSPMAIVVCASLKRRSPGIMRPIGYRIVLPPPKTFFLRRSSWGLVQCGAASIRRRKRRRPLQMSLLWVKIRFRSTSSSSVIPRKRPRPGISLTSNVSIL